LSVDTLLAGLGLDVNTRRALVNNLGKAQEKSFSVNPRYKKQLSEKFRGERRSLEALLTKSAGDGELPPLALAALTRFAGRLETVRAEIEHAQQSGELIKSIAELAGNYVHMHLNRLFRSAANAQEMVLYDFLARTYDSRMAREKPRQSAVGKDALAQPDPLPPVANSGHVGDPDPQES